MSVRRLGQDDIAEMRVLNALFSDTFEAPDDYAAKVPNDAYLQAQLSDSHVIALAAYSAGLMVGGLTGYVLRKLEQARCEVYIYDLAVLESERRQGAATALVDAVRAIARDCGAWVIFVQADHGDDPAIALYSKLGSREDVLHFDIDPNDN